MRLGLGLGVDIQHLSGGGGGGADYPIVRRDLRQEDDFFVLLENGDKIVITFGTFDSVLLEDASFLLQEDSGKLIIQAN